MPQVPYNPVPGVRDLGRPIHPGTGAEPIHVETPAIGPEAFGARVGAAMTHYGEIEQNAGEEIFKRGQAFQALANANDANTAVSDYDKEATQLQEKLKMQEGKNAVEAFQNYPEQLEAIRQKYRQGLSLDAQRMYDGESRGIYARALASSANYAGTQHRVWTDTVSKATTANTMRSASLAPENISHFDDTLEKVKQDTIAQFGGKGWDDTSMRMKIAENVSSTVRGAVEDLAITDPTTAERILKERKAAGQVSDDDYVPAMQRIDGYAHQVITRGAIADVQSGRVQILGDHRISIERARDAIGGVESRNSYNSPPHDSGSARCGEVLGRYQNCSNFLPDYLKRAGMPAMTPQEFLNNPAAQDQLFSTIFQQDMDKYGSFNEAASHWFTGRSLADARANMATDKYNTTVDKYLTMAGQRLAITAQRQEFNAAVQTTGTRLRPDDPQLPQILENAANTVYNKNAQLAKEMNADYRNTITHALSTPDENGRYITNIDQLWADPARKRAWDNLDEPQQAAFLKRMDYNAKMVYQPTDVKRARFNVLDGMLNTAEGKEQFMNVDLNAENLPAPMTKHLLDKWERVRKSMDDSPLISKIESNFGAMLKDATIKKGSDDYYSFVSSVQGAIDAHYEEYKKPPNPQELQKIGAQILQKTATQYVFWGGQRQYEAIPDAMKEQITETLRKQYGADPSTHQVEREYFRQMYSVLFQVQHANEDAKPPALQSSTPVTPVSR